jgi:alpha-tubulin suppressor-like RCC1 family protein
LLTNDGKLWATGLNANGQLGLNSMNGYRLIHDEFTEVTCLYNTFEQSMTIDKIFCTSNLSGVVFKNRDMWTWGQNQGVQ